MPRRIRQFHTRRFGVRCFQQPYREDGVTKWTNRYYYRRIQGGKMHAFPLGMDREQAGKTAEEIFLFLEDARNTLADAITKFDRRRIEREEKAGALTIGEVTQLYERSYRTLEIKERTAHNNVLCLYLVLRVGLAGLRKQAVVLTPGKKADLTEFEKLPVSTLTERMGWDYREWVVDGIDDVPELRKARETANSTLRQAKSVFGEDALKMYRVKGLKLPDVSGFMSTPAFSVPRKYILPPAAVMEKVMIEAHALAKQDPEAYRAFFVCKQWGLRMGEAKALRMANVERFDSKRCRLQLTVNGDFAPKSGVGRTIFNDAWVIDHMAKWPKRDDGLVIGSNEAVFDRLNDWLRKVGLEREEFGKPKHELRAWWISWKLTRDGLHTAQREAGHADPKTTDKHYGDCHFPEQVRRYYEDAALA